MGREPDPRRPLHGWRRPNSALRRLERARCVAADGPGVRTRSFAGVGQGDLLCHDSGSQFRPVPPPALSSSMYAFDFNLTKELGAKNSATRTAEQTAIAQFWADGPGTVTPPGHWNVIARDIALQRKMALTENARLFALLNLALADAAICCWDGKYEFKCWRPITAIHEADTDRNPATGQDPAWTPLLATPPFPEYTSGHSTFSSAAATVLARYFGSDTVPFSATSEAMPSFSRSYQSFSEAAAEAGLSRIYGGLHFMSANQQGLLSGASLGAYVAEGFLKEKRPPGAMNTAQPMGAERAGSVSPVVPLAPLPVAVATAASGAAPQAQTPAVRTFRPYPIRQAPRVEPPKNAGPARPFSSTQSTPILSLPGETPIQ